MKRRKVIISILKLKWYLWGKVEKSIVENGDTVPTFGKYRHGGDSLKNVVEKESEAMKCTNKGRNLLLPLFSQPNSQILGSLIPRPSAEPYSPLFQPHCTLGLTPWLPGKWQGGSEPKVTAPRKAAKAALSPEASGRNNTEGRRAKQLPLWNAELCPVCQGTLVQSFVPKNFLKSLKRLRGVRVCAG